MRKKEKSRMHHNVCKTCGAKDGRAGVLINDECLNCHDTRETGTAMIRSYLTRTDEEIKKTLAILDKSKASA